MYLPENVALTYGADEVFRIVGSGRASQRALSVHTSRQGAMKWLRQHGYMEAPWRGEMQAKGLDALGYFRRAV